MLLERRPRTRATPPSPLPHPVPLPRLPYPCCTPLPGVYLDFDVLLARPIRLTKPAAAGSAAPANGAPRVLGGVPPLRDALGIESYEGLSGLAGPTLNGAVMVFDRGSRFLWNCLDDFAWQAPPPVPLAPSRPISSDRSARLLLPGSTWPTGGAGTGPSC